MEQLVCFKSSLDDKVDHIYWKENQEYPTISSWVAQKEDQRLSHNWRRLEYGQPSFATFRAYSKDFCYHAPRPRCSN